MKFDKVYNDLFEKLGLTEMAIHLHNEEPIIDPATGSRARHSPRDADQNKLWSQRGAPEIGVDTPSERQAKVQSFKDRLQQRIAEPRDSYTMSDLIKGVKDTAGLAKSPPPRELIIPSAVCDVFADNLISILFPKGVDPSRTWSEFTDTQGSVFQKTEAAFAATATHFTDLIGKPVPLALSKKTRIGYFVNNILKKIIKGTAENPSSVVLSDIDDADYLEGSTSARGRKPKGAIAADDAAPRFTTYQEQYRLDEMPVSLKKDTTLGDTSGHDTVRRVMRHTFADKHSRINDPKNTAGSNTHHIGNLARHLSGKDNIGEVGTEEIHNASDMFAKIVHDKMFEIHNGVNPAMNQKEFRKLMSKAVEDAIEILEDEYGVDVFEEINNLPEFTARIIDNGLKDMFASVRTGYDGTFKTWKKERPGSNINEQDGDEDDEEDEDGDEEAIKKTSVQEADENKWNDEEEEDEDEEDEDQEDDIAYKQGILKDADDDSEKGSEEEEEEEEEPSEDQQEDSADSAASNVERTGRDIAQMFMQALADLEAEEDTEEDDIVDDDDILDDEDSDVKPYISRGNIEDEEEERYSSWGDFQGNDEY